MFCSKCGKEISNDAMFCSYCGFTTSNANQQQSVHSERPVNYPHQAALNQYNVYNPPKPLVPKTAGPILVPKERGFIIAASVIYMALGIITALIAITSTETILNTLSYDYRDIMKNAVTVGSVIGLGINLFFGIMSLLYKRWALLVLRVITILGIIGNGFSIIQFFVQIGQISQTYSGYGYTVKINYIMLFVYLLQIGFNIMLLCFINTGAKALSYNVQSYREKSKDRGSVFANTTTEDCWICGSCGAHNKKGDSFCKDCGKYK